jgi:L-iditol 2-dehydrogenase
MEIGSGVKNLKPGQPVAVEPAICCGQCDQCRAGRRHTCRKLQFMGCPGQAPGVMAEFLTIPAECCFPVPKSMTQVQAALAEPLSIGVYAHRLSGMPAGKTSAVLGAGPIGLCTLLSIRTKGPGAAYVTDLLDNRLDVAKQCGADWTGSPEREDIVAEILKREPLGLDYVFECAGKQATLDQAVDLLKPGGTLVMVGIPECGRVSFSIDLLRRKELRLQNVRRQNECLGLAVNLIASKTIHADPLVTHQFPLERVKDAFEMVADYRDGVIKAMIRVSE